MSLKISEYFLQELCECLWDISKKRKMEDEKEMSAVMGEGFLEEHMALLVNNHSMLMQVDFWSSFG